MTCLLIVEAIYFYSRRDLPLITVNRDSRNKLKGGTKVCSGSCVPYIFYICDSAVLMSTHLCRQISMYPSISLDASKKKKKNREGQALLSFHGEGQGNRRTQENPLFVSCFYFHLHCRALNFVSHSREELE